MSDPTDEMLDVIQELHPLDRTDAEAIARATLAIVERERVAPLLNLLRDLTDRDECWFDHHGGCQAHGYISLEPGEKCPHAEAKEILGREGIGL